MQWKTYENGPFQWSNKQHKEIERIAYFMWLDAGKPQGRDLEFWVKAETRYLFPQPTHNWMTHNWMTDNKDSLNAPQGFDPAKPILTRYGKKLLEQEVVVEEV